MSGNITLAETDFLQIEIHFSQSAQHFVMTFAAVSYI